MPSKNAKILSENHEVRRDISVIRRGGMSNLQPKF